MKEQEILKRISENDTGVFELIYDRWFAPLCIYASRFLQDNDDAEEVVQGVMVKLWEQGHDIRKIQSLNSYLFKMVYNVCINKIEHGKVVQKHRDSAVYELQELEWQAFDHDDSDDYGELNKALDQLPPKNKEIFKLHYFEGLKHKEIAEKLNISDRTVETHIVKGLKKLRGFLKKNIQLLFF